jgi:hypothetical protein
MRLMASSLKAKRQITKRPNAATTDGQQADDERASRAELDARHHPLHDRHRAHASVLQRACQSRVPGSVEQLEVTADREERAERHAIERDRGGGRVHPHDEGCIHDGAHFTNMP